MLIQACALYETLIIHVIPGLVLLMFLQLVEGILLCYLTLFSQVCFSGIMLKAPQGKCMHHTHVHDDFLLDVHTCLQERIMYT